MYLIHLLPRLRSDTRAVAMMEFALTLPLLLFFTMWGVELSNYSLAQLRVSQIALALADNASRVGSSELATQQLREVDLSDVLQAVRVQGAQLALTKYGRITLSSLEAGADDVQRIHWQRCIGQKAGTGYDSSYGSTDPADGTQPGPGYEGTTVIGGMGDAGAKVTAPAKSGVMFVEINYAYQPIFGGLLIASPRIHYVASFIVRDRRDFTQVFNPSPAVAAADRQTCDRYAA